LSGSFAGKFRRKFIGNCRELQGTSPRNFTESRPFLPSE